MYASTAATSKTRLSLLARVRNTDGGRSWNELRTIYRPLIFGCLRSLSLKEDDAHDLTREVFCRWMANLATLVLDRRRGRSRTYLWTPTYTTHVVGARRRKVRDWVLWRFAVQRNRAVPSRSTDTSQADS
jgi:DNA-directed RNA polymerase specialized sigma24 family protein